MEKLSAPRWDWLSAILLFLLIQAAAARLIVTEWAPFLFYAQTLAAFGAALGLALGVSQYKRRVVIWFVIDYTLAVLPWQMSRAADKGLPFAERFLNVGGALLASFDQFVQRQPVEDSFFFVAVVSFAFWMLALTAGYWLARHNNMLAAIVPSGVAILVIQAYDNFRPNSSWWLAFYILLSLLLLGRQYYLQSLNVWTARRVFINEEAWLNIFGGLFATTASAVVIAWLIPTSFSGLQSAADAWNYFTRPIRENLSNAITSLEAPYGSGGSNFYGETLALGLNASLGDSPVFTVRVLSGANPSRYYWRGRVFDFYSNGQWISTPASSFDFDAASANLNIPNADGRSAALLQFTFEFQTQSLLYAPSQPVWINRRSIVSAAPIDANIRDVLAWNADPALRRGDRYQVRALIASPSIQQLRAAGAEYPQSAADFPQWVKDRYLEVPDNIRADFKALAEKITEGMDNPYDKASAITNYLRANIQYATSVPAPPQGREPLTWALFTYKKGFCNYYASEEVMLLRSIGIPARLAVGFAQGEQEGQTFIVRRRDAHAWPEVYFPGIGWVEFEPTVSQDPLARPAANQDNAGINPVPPQQRARGEGDETRDASSSEEGAARSDRPFAQTIAGRALTIILPLFAVMALVFLFYKYRVLTFTPLYVSKALERGGLTSPLWVENWWRWNQLEPVERSFDAINASLRWLGQPQPIDATPAERAALLKKLLPSAAQHIEALSSELESGLFTPRPANLSRARRASFFILLHAIRAPILDFLGAIDGRDVYSR